MVPKWSRDDLGLFKHHFPLNFQEMEIPKWGRRPKAAAPTLGGRPEAALCISQKLEGKLCSNGPRSSRDHFGTISTQFFDHCLTMSSGKVQNHFCYHFREISQMCICRGHASRNKAACQSILIHVAIEITDLQTLHQSGKLCPALPFGRFFLMLVDESAA